MINIYTDFIYLLLLILCLYNIKISKIGDFNNDYISVKQTNALKGLCAIIIVLHHIATNIEVKASSISSLFRIFLSAGPWAVMIFFFLSGYGVQYKYINDSTYSKKFLLKRYKSILPLYIISLIVYILINTLYGKTYSLFSIVSQFKDDKNLIVPNSWFIIVILFFYLFYYLSMRLFKKHYNYMVLFIFAICMCWMVLNRFIFTQYGTWWSDYTLSLPFGMIWAINKNNIEKIIEKNYLVNLLLSLGLFIGVQFVIPENCEIIRSILFPMLVMIILMKIKIDNKILNYLGSISYEIYLFHGLFVNILLNNKAIISYKNGFMYVTISLIGTILVAAIISKLNKYIKDVIK